MKNRLKHVFLSLGAMVLLAGGVPAAPRQPNFIVVLIDDMGWMDSSTYGSEYYQTPNLTRLAEEGMLFTDAYAASPLCSPTRSSIMSGQDPARTGFTSAAGHVVAVNLEKTLAPNARPDHKVRTPKSVSRLDPSYTTLAEVIHEAGYVTGDTTANFNGFTFDGIHIMGSDSICIRPPE